MQVWELIAELSKRPAGESVHIARSESHAYMEITDANCSVMGEMIIYGDGSDDMTTDED